MTLTENRGPVAERTRVAVIGGGASGVLTAINLLVRSDDPALEVVVHEASGIVGRGIAYGTNDQRHLLNVRARHMSAFPDSPSDLLDWALRTGRSSDPQGFLPRADYAIYLQDRLADVADDRLRVRAGRVLDVVPAADGFEIVTERSRSTADAVVLCHGNQPPRPLTVAATGEALPEAPWHVANPWQARPSAGAARRGQDRRGGHRPDRGRHRHHAAGGRPGPRGHHAQPPRPAAQAARRPGPHRLGHQGARGAGHRRRDRRGRHRGVQGRRRARGRLARGRRRSAPGHAGPVAPAAARRAPALPGGLRPRLGGTTPPDGARRRAPAAALPLRGPPARAPRDPGDRHRPR
ncbi:FAD/NAD(P)-binding protein [Nocardioides convexus]|uniref:FAD/NAD(P)-binding protein n=1 Tax=Nocardioides convexus TaxID=2712224 RepID=UPI002418A04E|nr:FAD/NAD(P)-binding protein [Nocardioides convexus]